MVHAKLSFSLSLLSCADSFFINDFRIPPWIDNSQNDQSCRLERHPWHVLRLLLLLLLPKTMMISCEACRPTWPFPDAFVPIPLATRVLVSKSRPSPCRCYCCCYYLCGGFPNLVTWTSFLPRHTIHRTKHIRPCDLRRESSSSSSSSWFGNEVADTHRA